MSAGRRALRGAFHDYVRAVFAECSAHARALRVRRATWLHRISRQSTITIRATNLYARD